MLLRARAAIAAAQQLGEHGRWSSCSQPFMQRGDGLKGCDVMRLMYNHHPHHPDSSPRPASQSPHLLAGGACAAKRLRTLHISVVWPHVSASMTGTRPWGVVVSPQWSGDAAETSGVIFWVLSCSRLMPAHPLVMTNKWYPPNRADSALRAHFCSGFFAVYEHSLFGN